MLKSASRFSRALLLAVLMMLPFFSALAMESTCPPSMDAVATLLSGESSLAVYSDTDKTERVGTLRKGTTARVIGAEGRFYRIAFDGVDGYAAKSKLRLKGAESQERRNGKVVTDLALDTYLYTSVSKAKSMPVRGTVETESPLDTVFFFLWDERLQRVEQVLALPVPEPKAQLDIRDVCKNIAFSSMTAGRKTLIISGASDGEMLNLFEAPVYVCGAFKPVRNINADCAFSAGSNKKDGTGRSWTPSAAKPTMTITLPKDGSAALMTIEWRKPVDSFTVEYFDADKQPIGQETKTTGFYVDAVAFPKDAASVRLSIEGKENWVRTLCVYDSRYPDNAVQQWQPVPEKLDLMVISAHQDDEFLFLGGTIPYACAKGLDVGVVYMTNGGRSRYTEAMDGLWTAGLRTHPIYMNWRDQKVNSINIARKTWSQNGVDPQMEVVRLIRRYKPEVIVTQDLEGEYGHTQHKLTARLVADAIPLAKDESYDPESVAEYGAWEVKKVYLHLYGENKVEIDWDEPLSPDSPISPMFLAQEAFDKHRSQQRAYSMTREAKTYNNRLFGLYYTAVGPDEAKNNFFEHLDLAR
ncbi:MAG: PIG-L family deacetylase [Clostridia bacterium]|nr:PIG-L family deacetylase [Clostridia bacterium]